MRQMMHSCFSMNRIDSIISRYAPGRVLLVCGKSGFGTKVRERLESLGVSYVVFDRYTANPKYEEVCDGVQVFNAESCDMIVAVGGGSCMDVAKCIKLYCKMDHTRHYLEQEPFDTQVPLVAVPTTAGTGSEATRFAVIYYQGKKQSVNHVSIIPNEAVLVPEVLESLPAYQKKCTVLDAYCQAIESWWSVNATEESHMLSRQAVESLTDAILPYVNGWGDNAAVMKASNVAGQAINLTQTTAAHACSYKLTSLYGLPHGHAVAVCLPVIWRYMLDHPERCIDARGQEYMQGVFADIAHAMGCATPLEAVQKFEAMMAMMDMRRPALTQREADLDMLVSSVNPVRLKNNPVRLDEEAIRGIYELVIMN